MRLRAIACLIASSSYAMAGGLVITGGSPRAIGRAGVGTVGDDGVGALLVNPAAMARREGERGQLGLAFTDDEIAWLGTDGNQPIYRNQSASDFAPTGGAFTSAFGFVIGLGAMTSSVTDRQMWTEFPPKALTDQFAFRYAGVAGSFQRDTVTLGAARRIGDQVAVGLAVAASRVTISEYRRIWAGFGGRDVIGDPELDVEMSMAGTDWFAPSAVAGLLFAPDDAPLELAASLAWAQTINIDDGDVGAVTAGTTKAPRVAIADPRAQLRLRQPVTLRAGGRYIGERFVVEVNGDIWIAADAANEATWRVSGVRVRDRSNVEAPVQRVPSRISMRTHGAFRTAIDYELIAGFLWATGGYAYQVAGVADGRQSPSFGDLGGHTMALGLEGSAGGFNFTLGWSRTWELGRERDTVLSMDNPFNAGERLVPLGRYGGSIDQIGILVDAELDTDD